MGRIINKDRTNHEDGSFTMTPIDGVPATLEEFIAQWQENHGTEPVGPMLMDLDRFQEGEENVDAEKIGKPRILAGKNGPYIRIVSRRFRGYDPVTRRRFKTHLMGTVNQVKNETTGEPELELNNKPPRRRQRTTAQTAGSSAE